MAENVDAALPDSTRLGVKHIDADVFVDQQRIACAKHEKRRMHIKHAFL